MKTAKEFLIEKRINPNETIWNNQSAHISLENLLEEYRNQSDSPPQGDVESVIPPTFYADRDLKFRVERLVEQWNKAVRIINSLEESKQGDVEIRSRIETILFSAYSAGRNTGIALKEHTPVRTFGEWNKDNEVVDSILKALQSSAKEFTAQQMINMFIEGRNTDIGNEFAEDVAKTILDNYRKGKV